MAALIKMRVLIVGLRSVGIEAAKNLVLAGPAEVILYDPALATVEDLGYNYFLTPASLGKRRDECSAGSLQELNPKNVVVSVLPAAPSAEQLQGYSAVIATCAPRATMSAMNDTCHAAGVPFIAADIAGAAGWAFSDFGAIQRDAAGKVTRGHLVRDADGVAPRSAVVVGITPLEGKPNRLLVSTHDSKRHGLVSGDYVTFAEVEGIPALNDGRARRVCGAIIDGGKSKVFQFEVQLEDEEANPDVLLPAPAAAVGGGGGAGGGASAKAAADGYSGGGVVTQVKLPTYKGYQPLSVRRTSPVAEGDFGLLTMDLSKFGQCEALHVAFEAVEAYRAAHGGAPPPLRDAAAIQECCALAGAFVAANSATLAPHPLAAPPHDALVNAAVVARVAALAGSELPALGAVLGGIVAQEAVKATGKFTPLGQWLYVEGFECFPDGADPALLVPGGAAAAVSTSASSSASSSSSSASSAAAPPAVLAPLPASEFAPSGSRYDGVTAILGRTLQAAVMDQRVFVVGAGALGCEFLKNYALMGVGAGAGGRITVTDMDNIEVSNLNRQFLFRQQHVGAPKSVTAAAAAVAMNPELKIEALETAVGRDTEKVFNDPFWEGLTLVTNALDNVTARKYVDAQCVWYSKPLLESGTLGALANVQVVKPFDTETYGDSDDPAEEAIPMCTLKNFPFNIDHCIEWARDLFAGNFVSATADAKAFLRDPAAWFAGSAAEVNTAMRRKGMAEMLAVLDAAAVGTFAECVKQARFMFNASFEANISQLLHNFPRDYKDATGTKFWSGTKRAPTPAAFSLEDPEHAAFLVHATALVAANYGVALPPGWEQPSTLAPILAAIHVPAFEPKKVYIKTGDKDEKAEGGEDDHEALAAMTATINAKVSALGAAGLAALKVFPAEFEKDDDANHHIDFIAAAANLRATNYAIPTASRHTVKMTAGKIIPAIASTTCTVTGLVCLEFYKLVARKPVTALRNSYISLAVNNFSQSEPNGPRRKVSVEYDKVMMGPVKVHPEGHSRWDKFVINEGRDLTLGELTAWLKAKHGLTLEMLLCEGITLYYPGMFPKQVAERGGRGVFEQYTASRAAKVPPPAPMPDTRRYLVLELGVQDAEGNDVLTPTVQYFCRGF